MKFEYIAFLALVPALNPKKFEYEAFVALLPAPLPIKFEFDDPEAFTPALLPMYIVVSVLPLSPALKERILLPVTEKG